jgi:hypothetical protein
VPADELPDVGVEAAKFSLEPEERLRIVDDGFDFAPVADDAWVAQKGLEFLPVVGGDRLGVEVIEGRAIVRALLQDGDPAQPCLGGLEDEELKEPPIVMQRHSPLFVVICNQQVADCPPTADDCHDRYCNA